MNDNPNNLPAEHDVSGVARNVFIKGDLSKLTGQEQVNYYIAVCRSIGLNPLTRPFEYLYLSGKLTLYALRTCTDQLRQIHNVSITIKDRTARDGVMIVHAAATMPNGRIDEDFGVVPLPEKMLGELRSNTIMKAVTKAKRRVTLSICGLGFLDETEIDSIPEGSKRPAEQPSDDALTKAQYETQAPHGEKR
jgi:hypothetical protein